jgi:hypothetical protein
MSDKGRETIKQAMHICNISGNIECLERHLRSHGWVHEDDVVEGHYKCDEHDRECRQRAFRPNVCQLIPCEFLKPAKVKDLIRKEG